MLPDGERGSLRILEAVAQPGAPQGSPQVGRERCAPHYGIKPAATRLRTVPRLSVAWLLPVILTTPVQLPSVCDPGITAGELFPRVKHSFKFPDASHHVVEVRFLAKVHFNDFLVVPADRFFEPGTRREPESSPFGKVITRTALAKEGLFMLRNLLQQTEVP